MRLYHYANEPLPVLKTREVQGTVTNEMRASALEEMELHQTPGPYYAHISFFVDPLDLITIADIFKGHNHSVWQAGNTVYEHIVESSELGNFDYLWTETAIDKQFMDDRWRGDALSDAEVSRYFSDLAEAKRKAGLIGKGNLNFERVSEQFLGETMGAYQEASKLNNGRNWQQYAANVPHVMIYPPKGLARLLEKPRKEVIGVKRTIKRAPSLKW